MFDYDADAMWNIQPQGRGLSYFGLIFDIYSSLRRLGHSIDFISPKYKNFDDYKLVIVSGMMHIPEELKKSLQNSKSSILFGPRSASKDENICIPETLPPNLKNFDVLVTRVQTLRPDINLPLNGKGNIKGYFENIEGSAEDLLTTSDNQSVAKFHKNLSYLGSWLDCDGFDSLFENLCIKVGLKVESMPYGVRRRETTKFYFWFNYNSYDVETKFGIIKAADFLKIKRA